ncbi:PREDICTED: E3 ubiquitin-protein ligase SDIR1 [Camelina sativa]|uniref:RING-type E3 ubiquitin transferase n=1 Tax=Camelina sativa TaxID=90675 RepID=A0ABM0VY14_CAMSA|nr:PREDICTED: E3 ubiquitin-protein ligase SDIR1 [Camelina sativa]
MEVQLTFRSEIDLKPKSEDAGTLKICVSLSGTSLDRENLYLSYDDFESVESTFPNDLKELNEWLFLAGLTHQDVDIANRKLTERIYHNLISIVDFPVSATLVYMYCKVIHPPRNDEAVQAETNNIRLVKPASKLSVGRLARKICKKNKKKTSNSDDNMCSIFLEGFEKGEIVVTLPCGHEFDDSCIVKWFRIYHVCPLCRFELPCKEMTN